LKGKVVESSVLANIREEEYRDFSNAANVVEAKEDSPEVSEEREIVAELS
jgi:hypothetical protein